MKKIITSIVLTACVALCAAVWPRSAEDRIVPAEPVKNAVNADITVNPKETSQVISSAEDNNPKPELGLDIEPPEMSITVKTENPESTQPTEPVSKTTSPSAQPSADPKSGSKTVIDGKPYVWIPGFGWIEDHGGGSVSIPVGSEGDINKQVGIMGGGTTVGNPGDELTGHKVGIMGGGSVAEDMYENGNKIGIMGGDDSHTEKVNPPQSELSEPTGEVIYVPLQPPVTKDSTPPNYKPTSSGQ